MGVTSGLTHAVKARKPASARPLVAHSAADIASALVVGAALALAGAAAVCRPPRHTAQRDDGVDLVGHGLRRRHAGRGDRRRATPGSRLDAGPAHGADRRRALCSARARRLAVPGTRRRRAAGQRSTPALAAAAAHRARGDRARRPPARPRGPGLASARARSRGHSRGRRLLLGIAAFLPSESHDPIVLIRVAILLLLALGALAALRGRTVAQPVRLALGVMIPVALVLLAWDVSFQVLTRTTRTSISGPPTTSATAATCSWTTTRSTASGSSTS